MTRPSLAPGYEPIADILDRALWQAQHGMGKESRDDPFNLRPIDGSAQFAINRAAKKAREALLMPRPPAIRELLDAIVDLAAAVRVLERPAPALPDDHNFDIGATLEDTPSPPGTKPPGDIAAERSHEAWPWFVRALEKQGPQGDTLSAAWLWFRDGWAANVARQQSAATNWWCDNG